MDLIGQRLGNYRLVRLLGEGGYAQVYLSEHTGLGTPAAIKVIHAQVAARDVARFFQEARAVAHLEHPHIVRVLECAVAEDRPYLVMEYAPGGTVRQRQAADIPLALPTILSYVQQTAAALAYAHAQKLIHLDVKPENLLIGAQRQLLLADFGFARLSPSSSQLPLPEVGGTVAYMAPEQVQGKPQRASDQYALGVMVYEWLTGTPLFTGSVSDLIEQQLHRTPPSVRERVPTIGKTVEAVVLRALAKDPRARFPSVIAFATTFTAACQDEGRLFSAPSPVPTFRPGLQPVAAENAGPSVPVGGQPAVQPPQASPSPVPLPALLFPGAEPATLLTAASDDRPLKWPGSAKRAALRQPLARWLPLGLTLLVLLLVGGGLLWQLTRFQPTVITGKYVTRIQVGVGVDPTTGAVQGASATFRVGTTLVLVCAIAGWSDYAQARLFQGATLEATQQWKMTDVPASFANQAGFFTASATPLHAGRYRWEVDLLSFGAVRVDRADASITFQVTS